ncbi:MAG TPA: urease accessory protein UreD [Chloroflexota bacterium]
MKGELFLRAGVVRGRPALIESRAAFPLQIVRPRYWESSGTLAVTILTPCGGLLDGDELSIEVVVDEGASLHLAAQAATQVHSGVTAQTMSVQIGPGAAFSYVPHELVPHAGANHHSRSRVAMAPDSRLFWSELIAPGRLHRDESFAYEQLRSTLDVHSDRGLVARERQLLRPSEMDTQLRLGGYSHFATGYCFPALKSAPPQREGLSFGASALFGDGSYIRALGHRSFDLADLMQEFLCVWHRERGCWADQFRAPSSLPFTSP